MTLSLPSGKLTWLLKMAIYIEDLPFKHGDFPYSFVYVYQRVSCNNNVGRDANGRISSTDFSVVFPLTWLASQ